MLPHNTDQTTDQKRKAKESAERIAQAEAFACVFERGINRHNRTGDPVLRATLLFDKLCLIADMMSSYISSSAVDSDGNEIYPPELKNRIANCSKLLNTELDFILDWITSPTYSPDHPYGKHVMNSANDSFNSFAASRQASSKPVGVNGEPGDTNK
jgi:hypothetical protein